MARIVFDLDGTLINSAPEIQNIANLLLVERGRPTLSLTETISFIGNGPAVLIEKMCAARDLPKADQPALLDQFLTSYTQSSHLSVAYPHVPEVLQQLRDQGHLLGICTNKPHAPALVVLDHLGLLPFFDVVLGGDSLRTRKPDPAPLQAAFAGLGDGPMIYVGDSDVDAETAQRAAVPFLLFAEGYCKRPHAELPHHALFSDFTDLPGHIDQLLAS